MSSTQRNTLRGACWVAASLLVAGIASGNGRFPRAQRLVESATDPKVLALYGTYGLIVSSDAGATWNHVCEAATGAYTGEDPLLEILPDQKLVARTEVALVRSADTWCNWTTIRDGSTNVVQDITRDPSAPLSILALVGVLDPNTGFSSSLIQSTDGGTTWSAEKKLQVIARGLSLDVAPSSSKRIVVSGLDSGSAGTLLVSDDGGGTWLRRVLTGTDSNSAPYLVAISKNDPDRIFVRTDAYEDINGIDTASDSLLMTTDGGKTWSTAIHRNAKLFGVALSPDEQTLLVGYGDPVVAATYVEPADLGIYRVDMATVLADPANAATHFEKIHEASVTCLRWTASGLYACTSQSESGFEVGRAPDASFTTADAKPFTPLLLLPKVRPLPCSAGTDGFACYSDQTNGFASVCQVFQASCDASPPPSTGGAPDSGVAGSPVEAGTTGTGGAPASGGGSGGTMTGTGGASLAGSSGQVAAGGSAAAPTSSGKDSESCGCRTVGANTRGAPELLLIALAALVRRRRQ